MFIAKNLKLHFGGHAIFDDVSFNINSNQRIGLVGRNGSGKTTLFKVIVGIQHLDSGSVAIQKDKKIAYLPQDVVLLSNKTILTEALNVFDGLGDKLVMFYDLEKKLCQNSSKDIESYSLLQCELFEENYNNKIVKTKKILLGLGF